jgi:hypothetical protein
VLINTSTDSYLAEGAFDTFGDDHIPAPGVQAVTIINEYHKYEASESHL